MVKFHSSRLENIASYWKRKHPGGVETERDLDAVSLLPKALLRTGKRRAPPFVLEIVSIDSTINHSVEPY